MSRLITLLFFILWAQFAYNQSNTWVDLAESRLHKQRTGMLVLGTWALGNMAVGVARLNQGTPEQRAFQQMQIGWNAVNLGIATLGYFGSLQADPSTWNTFEAVQEHYKIQKVLLFNAGLDVGYMLGGAYLMERGKNVQKNAERLRGFGRSILLQGAFLFVFDVSLYTLLSKDNPQLKPLLSQVDVNLRPNQLQFSIHLNKTNPQQNRILATSY